MLIRIAEAKDESALLVLRNDHVTRANSFQTELISPENHHIWFTKKLTDQNSCIYILENETQQLIGQARYDKLDNMSAEVNIALDSNYRGKGLGKEILSKSLKLAITQLAIKHIFAQVKADNVISQKLFLSCGFEFFSESPPILKFIYRSER